MRSFTRWCAPGGHRPEAADLDRGRDDRLCRPAYIEGIGILRGKRWGGLLIILATSSLIPLECYEIVRRHSLVRIAALVLNVGIVVYLIVNRRKLTPERLQSRVK